MNKQIGIALVIVGLLVVLGLSHTLTDTTALDIAGPAPEDPHANQEDAEQFKVVLPDPMGPKDAPVQIKVYVTTDNECDQTTLHGMMDVGREFGDDVYIEFADLLEEDVQQEAHKAKIGCKAGLTINGKSKFILPGQGTKGAVLLDGPIGQQNYDIDDVKAVITYHLEQEKTPEKPDKDD